MTGATLTELPLFAGARLTDPATSHAAAEKIAGVRTKLHLAVLDAFIRALPGDLNDRELEQLPQFEKYAPSTVRKRRSELFQHEDLVAIGERNGLTTWTVAAVHQP